MKDELLEHHEGQRIFTLRRILFAATLAVVGAAVLVACVYREHVA